MGALKEPKTEGEIVALRTALAEANVHVRVAMARLDDLERSLRSTQPCECGYDEPLGDEDARRHEA